jgi:ornithine carbamoyltransferase
MLPVMLRPEELQLGRGELLEDTARVLAGYCSAIAMRVFSHGTLERVAAAAEVPVINLLSDDHHPCQALADLLTIRERFGRLLGRRIAYVGDGNNVAHSLLEAAPLAGMDIALACPPGYWPDAEIVYAASRQARKVGTEVIVVDDPREAAAGAHAVYTDVWVSMGEEGEQSERLTDLAGYRVTPELMAAARPEAVFMHCLPAHRGQEVDAAVIDGPASVVFEQAANRLPTEQAVLHTLLTRAPA